MLKNQLPSGWFSDDDIFLYNEFYSKLKPKSKTLEIGCWLGRSICSVAPHIIEKQIDVFIIDTFEGSEDHKTGLHKLATETDLKILFLNNIEIFFTENKNLIHTIKGDSRNKLLFSENFDDILFDFIFIDGGHSIDNVKSDIENSIKYVKENGIIAGHDYIFDRVKIGVNSIFSNVEVDGNIWWKEIKNSKSTQK